MIHFNDSEHIFYFFFFFIFFFPFLIFFFFFYNSRTKWPGHGWYIIYNNTANFINIWPVNPFETVMVINNKIELN